MKKHFLPIIMLGLFVYTSPSLAQFTPSGSSSPKAVVKRFEKENFRDIKLLYIAMMNYGGGEGEFSRLVSGYAEASGKYFSREYDESAKAFKKNAQEINDSGMTIATKYKDRTVELQKEVIELNVKIRIKNSLDNKKEDQVLEKIVHESSESLIKANDFFQRKKPVEAIRLYRRCKEKCILFMDTVKEELDESFDRDRKDNKGQVYVSKEKEN